MNFDFVVYILCFNSEKKWVELFKRIEIFVNLKEVDFVELCLFLRVVYVVLDWFENWGERCNIDIGIVENWNFVFEYIFWSWVKGFIDVNMGKYMVESGINFIVGLIYINNFGSIFFFFVEFVV